MLEMPPVMEEREEIDEIIEENEELAQFSESNYVFTDISTSESDRVIQGLLSCKTCFSIFHFYYFLHPYHFSCTICCHRKMKELDRYTVQSSPDK